MARCALRFALAPLSGSIAHCWYHSTSLTVPFTDRKSTRLNSSHLPYTTLFRSRPFFTSYCHMTAIIVFVHPQANGPRPDLQARPCERSHIERWRDVPFDSHSHRLAVRLLTAGITRRA